MNPAQDWVTGKIGGGLDFDGFNDYVNCGTDSSLDITDEMTLATWIKMASRPASNHYSDVLWKDNRYALYLTGQEDTETVLSAYFVLNTGTIDTWKDADILLPLNTWLHVARIRLTNSSRTYYIMRAANGHFATGCVFVPNKVFRSLKAQTIFGKEIILCLAIL